MSLALKHFKLKVNETPLPLNLSNQAKKLHYFHYLKKLIELIHHHQARELDSEPFHLLDFGCSGGIGPEWRLLEPRLRAVGIDINESEVACLNQAEKNPNVRYVAGNLELSPEHPIRKERGTPFVCESHKAFAKTSAWDAYSRRKKHPETPQRNSKPEYVNFEKVLEEAGFGYVDFIKIDVDGPDFDILQALEPSLGRLQVLGLKLEVNFNGSSNPHDHTFHNMDRLMRKNGFDLYGLELRKYTKNALPGRFEGDFFGQTIKGALAQGDALYFLNQIPPNYSQIKILKLISLMTLLDQVDSAADHLLNLNEQELFKKAYLDAVASSEGFRNYEILIRQWKEKPETFFKNHT